jgi:hypothetical protein
MRMYGRAVITCLAVVSFRGIGWKYQIRILTATQHTLPWVREVINL